MVVVGKVLGRTATRLLQFLVGLVLGYLLPHLFQPLVPSSLPPTPPSHPSAPALAHAPRLPLMVGVMTAASYLDTRACSVWRTWGAEVVARGGEVRFFVGEGVAGGGWCGLPVVALAGVADSAYPPQAKSLAMLAWLAEHAPSASWVLRADDDVFVQVEQLLAFLAPLDPGTPHYLGQAGRGRGQEEGNLGLGRHQNFCMGGPGVLLSVAALRLLAPSLPACRAAPVTAHEDVELGRCVERAVGISCTWAYDMQTLFHHAASAEQERGVEVESSALGQEVLDHAITLHPVKQPEHMEGLALRAAARRRSRLRSQALRLEEVRLRLEAEEVVGAALPTLPALEGAWDLILGHQLYTLGAGGARRKVPAHMEKGVRGAVTHVLDAINREAMAKGRVIEYRDLYYAYVHQDPRQGATYILDLLLLYKRYRGNKMTVKVRRHVYLRQPLLPVVVAVEEEGATPPIPALGPGEGEAAEGDTRQTVHIIVPIAGQGKLAVLARFLANYEREVLAQLQPATLTVVVFAESEDPVEAAVREGVDMLEMAYPGYSFTVIPLRVPFSRALGLMAGAAPRAPADLLLLLDIDIQFSAAALATARTFTALGKSAYFPIVFSEFRDGGGYWRDFGFGVAAVCAADLAAVGGLDTAIQGWGKEDVGLYDRMVAGRLEVVRAVEPELVHLYHTVTCSPALPADQASMCATSRANTFLPLPALVDTVLNSTLLVV